MSLIYKGADALADPRVAEALAGIPIRSWDEHGLRFTNREGGVRKLGRKPRVFTLHWTGGTGGAERVFRVLKNRKTKDGKGLSVQLFADRDGVVWQFADLDERCRHASATNKYGPGIEFQSRGLDRVETAGAYTEMIHGRAHRVLAFTEPQLRAVVGFSKAFGHLFGLAQQVPTVGGDPFPGLLSPDEIAKYRGVLGHFHVSKNKLDPGLEVFRRLLRAGLNPAPVG